MQETTTKEVEGNVVLIKKKKGFTHDTTELKILRVLSQSKEQAIPRIVLLEDEQGARLTYIAALEQQNTLGALLSDPVHAAFLEDWRIAGYLRQLKSALLFLHGRNIVHNALVRSHLLVQGDEIQITTFAYSRPVMGFLSLPARYYEYEEIAPECKHTAVQSNPAADAYSLGVLASLMFERGEHKATAFNEYYTKELHDSIILATNRRPAQRIGVGQFAV